MSRFLAVDWGTTNRRAYLVEDGAVVATTRDDRGILAVEPGGFDAEVASLRARYSDVPIVLAGMVGSNRGWIDAGYVAAPATIDALAAKAVRPIDGVAIVPGVSRSVAGRGDVMRGEEVQLLGAAAAGMVPPDSLLCQPGTHCKWAWMKDGALADFVTAMTGELFALLKAHALIGQEMTGAVADDTAFGEGVADAGRDDLLGALFGVRAASVLGLRVAGTAASYVSGLLIGTDVRAHVRPGETVYLLADEALGALYARAIGMVGASTQRIDSHAAFVAGVTRIEELLG
ncbi:2-dehydro-3-deoxygalactonokinase [Hephaestia caeni]|uniref:2-dehydro-3-deoxygalactonokinase n=1 Tax=Hephaestia caeni TaxID=645617 RepID=A0A397NQH0_9SPHN|nr:2-dehydro-3-deoxygalactonokinase [Hephaestia caeni]